MTSFLCGRHKCMFPKNNKNINVLKKFEFHGFLST